MLCLLCCAVLPSPFNSLPHCSRWSKFSFWTMSNVHDARCGQSSSDGAKRRDLQGFGVFGTLPDDLVYKILRGVSPVFMDKDPNRCILPLVCKKWREVLCLQGGHSSFPI